jgi:hypothetical protein
MTATEEQRCALRTEFAHANGRGLQFYDYAKRLEDEVIRIRQAYPLWEELRPFIQEAIVEEANRMRDDIKRDEREATKRSCIAIVAQRMGYTNAERVIDAIRAIDGTG